MIKRILVAIVLFHMAVASAMPFSSQYALVVDENSGTVLFRKNSEVPVPIASLTKLMTAMVILDSKPDMNEIINIEQSDVDTIKHSSSRLQVGTALPRKVILQFALMCSDNRAAASLARTYPGGKNAFVASVRAKLKALGMTHTLIEEPTGLSPNNISTASDLVKMAEAAAMYPDIVRITTDPKDVIRVNGRHVQYHNTNRLVGKKGWDILLSKTGYTLEAGRCLIMRIQLIGRDVILVLLNAKASSARARDAMNIRRYVNNY
jgi:D-alanyl-D-alanine carboxypeptidase/D-alanyl-D-alanine endopeptidase (penicillin-binding protein 7)